MSLHRRIPLALLAVAALLAAGCGGDDESGTTTVAPETSGAGSAPAERDSGTAAFENEGGDNSIQEFGSAAPGTELQAAASTLHGYLDARAAREWKRACAHLAAGLVASLQELVAGRAKEASCPQLLAALSAGLPTATLRQVAEAKAGAFRRQGVQGFLLLHGADGQDYFVAMAREEGGWAVAALAPSPLG